MDFRMHGATIKIMFSLFPMCLRVVGRGNVNFFGGIRRRRINFTLCVVYFMEISLPFGWDNE
jgi:hypothetical protein